MAEDWYRSKIWSAEIEEAFFKKLKRCRSQGPQNLVIQALTLARIEPKVTLRLLDHYFVTNDQFDQSRAFCTQAQAFETLGCLDEAVEAYRRALEWEKSHPGMISNAWIDLPYLIATRSLRSHFELAIKILQSGQNGLIFHSQSFVYSVSLALIYWQTGQKALARKLAEQAVDAASIKKPQLPRHKNVGLVGPEAAVDLDRMKRIIDEKNPFIRGPVERLKGWLKRD